jgi:hypothetical protein
MTKVHATVMIYNDRTFLSALLESLKESPIDEIVFADGAYARYLENLRNWQPDAQPWSTDGSLEIIEAFKGLPAWRILRPPNNEAWPNQNAKRTAMINEVPNGDWFVGLDADEMVKGDVDEGFNDIFLSGCVAGQMPICNVGLDKDRLVPFWHPRLFEKMDGMHYEGTHWQLRDKSGRIIEEHYPVASTMRCVLVHFKAFKELDFSLRHETYIAEMGERGWMEPSQETVVP